MASPLGTAGNHCGQGTDGNCHAGSHNQGYNSVGSKLREVETETGTGGFVIRNGIVADGDFIYQGEMVAAQIHYASGLDGCRRERGESCTHSEFGLGFNQVEGGQEGLAVCTGCIDLGLIYGTETSSTPRRRPPPPARTC